ncbi:hypothetical protein WR25_20414 [Diploscapter pachys]|uniref:Lipid-binding serum glycoprotein C-terminal domain-containing protein n=1 Tax=Diploscapter pachys TaxID=2018661 RepID=A0A2A2JLW4_9BILA|nr:hypothetical protein WR25_20414 [Diploscapter pachys]
MNLPNVEHILPGEQGYIMIKRLRLSRFRRAVYHNITTLPPNRISWNMRNFDLGLIGDLSGLVNVVVQFQLIEKNKNGSAHVSTLSCTTRIREVEVVNHNGGLFGLAVSVFKQGVSENVRNLLQTLICKKIRKYIDVDLNEKLAEVQAKSPLSEAIEANSLKMMRLNMGGNDHLEIVSLFSQNIAKYFFIDFRLREPPLCGYDQVELASSGEISFKGLGGTPFGPSLMSWQDRVYPVSKQTSMLELLISDFLPNSFFYQAYKQRLIHVHLSQSSPPEIARFLRASCDSSFCISDLVPQLSDQFPNSSFELTVSATRAPAVLFSEKNGGKRVISLNIGGVVAIYTTQNAQKKQIGVLDIDVVADAKLTLQEHNVSGSVELTKFELNRRMGHIVISQTELSDIALLIARILENMINNMLSNGIPLPVPRG